MRADRARPPIAEERSENGSKRSTNRTARGGIAKKRKTMLPKADDDDDDDGDASMLADNEYEEGDDRRVWFGEDDEEEGFEDDFKSMSVEEIPLDEKAMHEDMRILIKVRVLQYKISLLIAFWMS